MSSAHAHAHARSHADAHGEGDAVPDALARTRGDPTRTKSLRRRYSQKLRGQYADLNTKIREGVVDRDVFDLRGESLQSRPMRDIPDLPYASNPRKHDGFMKWLREQQRAGVLRTIDRNGNTYLESGYKSGLRHAAAELRKAGVDVSDRDLEATFNLPVHQDSAAMLYTREYEALEGITQEVSKHASRELSEGFVRGYGPEKIARNLTDRVDKIGKTRATTMARTSIIDAHSTATLNRYEQAGVGGVTVKAEYSTAGDRRVCPLCQSIEGTTYTVEQARTETFHYSASGDDPAGLSGEYPVKPPIHPRCRCVWLPVV